MLKVDVGFIEFVHVFAKLRKERSIFLANAAYTTIAALQLARGNILWIDGWGVLAGFTVKATFAVASFMWVIFAFSCGIYCNKQDER